MILPNKILLFLVCCTIAVPCFGEACPDVQWINDICNSPDKLECDCKTKVIACPSGSGSCEEITITHIEKGTEDPICGKGYYVAYCDNTDLSLNSVLNVLTSSHYRFADKCWAVDGSLTTAQHYQNMRVVFNIGNSGNGYSDDGTMEDIILHMDTYSQKDDVDEGCLSGVDVDCNVNINRSKCVLAAWRAMVHNGCAAFAQNTGGISCLKCPNNGTTLNKVKIQRRKRNVIVAIAKAGTFEHINSNIIESNTEIAPTWISFNTIADCYITGGTDERGTFELDAADAKCYYSKE